jgi:NUC153 domain
VGIVFISALLSNFGGLFYLFSVYVGVRASCLSYVILASKLRRKKGPAATEESVDTFKIDVADSRFSRLFEGDASFGIDKTANEFKETPAVREILLEQSKRKQKKEARAAAASTVVAAEEKGGGDSRLASAQSLANKLKRKHSST